ncbi:MAG: helicase-related protein, partial [Anaerolineae bacterium]|nr:helicase-related protein [Anaerolineae bacterium]
RETPSERQTALFSATLPEAIRQLAERYMHSPETISVNPERITVAETEQRHYLIYEEDKLAALMRLLEVETVTGALIFTRTKVRAAEVADALVARGIQAEALHGDLTQAARETVLNRFRQGRLTFLVATDVAARGLDIEGISHVINFDLPFDAEAYVHRIGRTGRAGRAGVAISLLTPREKQGLRRIEAYTLQPIHRGKLPGVEDVLAYRDTLFIQRVEAALAQKDNAATEMVEQLCAAGHTPEELAAAAIQLVRAQEQHRPIEPVNEIQPYLPAHRRPAATRETRAQDERPHGARSRESGKKRDREKGMVRFILNAGKAQGIRPGDIVGAIAGEADIPGRDIGAIDIQERHTFVDVAEKHADKVFKRMKQFRMRQHRLTLKYAE